MASRLDAERLCAQLHQLVTYPLGIQLASIFRIVELNRMTQPAYRRAADHW